MKTRDLAKIGIPAGPCAEAAKQILQDAHTAKRSMAAVLDDLGRIAASPTTFLDDAIRGKRAGKEQESDYSSGPASSARWPRWLAATSRQSERNSRLGSRCKIRCGCKDFLRRARFPAKSYW